MAQVAFEKLTNEWVALSDKITVDEDANYYIQNRGADILLAQEAGETPQADNVNGTLIKPYEQAKYKANGGDLYLRAYNSNCSVNIISDKHQATVTWFDMTSDFESGDWDSDTGILPLTKTIDAYDILVNMGGNDEFAMDATVTTGGESAGTATTWLIIKDGNNEEVARYNFADLICESTSEQSFDFQTNEDSTVGYAGSLSIEIDAETDKAIFVEASPITYNGEELSTYLDPRIMVKCEA